MGDPLLSIVTTHLGGQGTQAVTRLVFPWDGSQDAGDNAASMVSDFWTAAAEYRSRDVKWSIPLQAPLFDAANGRLLAYLPVSGGRSGGGGDFGPMPGQLQATLRLATVARPGVRQLQGRLYVPMMSSPSQDIEGEGLDPGCISNLEDAARDHLLTPNDSHPTTVLGVWSKTYGQFSQVSQTRADSYYCILRSRGLAGR